MNASVVFRLQGRSYSVEAVVTRRRRQPIVASGEGPNFRVALDDLDAHVKRRLRRDRSRRKEFRHTSSDLPN
jgi:ribosome-associated translation inhibitor RaiA